MSQLSLHCPSVTVDAYARLYHPPVLSAAVERVEAPARVGGLIGGEGEGGVEVVVGCPEGHVSRDGGARLTDGWNAVFATC